MKIRAEINEKEMKEAITKIKKLKSWFCGKISKIDKLLTRLIKKKRSQINKIRNKKGDVTTVNTEIKRIIKVYYEQLHVRRRNRQILKNV